MAQEKEIKIQLKISLSDFIKRIQNDGFKLTHTLKQTDIYFDTKDWYLYENTAALRLRQIANKNYSFSFKKVFYLAKLQDFYIEEIEVKYPFQDFNTLKEMFEKLNIPFDKEVFKNKSSLTKHLALNNFFDEQIMPKTRRVYSKGEDEIVIDDVENVGIIVELECQKNNPLHVVKNLLKDNEWDRSLEGTSYAWLKNVKGLTSHIKNLERFKKEPSWNVWKNEIEFYNKIQKQTS
jgi:adenylate cyclase class IV